MTLRIIKTSYGSRGTYYLARHHNGCRRDDSVVYEPARSSINSEGEVIRVLNHNRFSGSAVTSIINSFSGVIDEGFSIAEAFEDCQFGAFCKPDWSGKSEILMEVSHPVIRRLFPERYATIRKTRDPICLWAGILRFKSGQCALKN